MSVIWLSKVKWETVWNSLQHIMIRQDFTVRTPSARLSGSGTGARLHIDLPATAAAAAEGYNGYFKITDITDKTDPENPIYKIRVSSGLVHVDGFFITGSSSSGNQFQTIRKIGTFPGVEVVITDNFTYIYGICQINLPYELQIVLTQSPYISGGIGTNAQHLIGRIALIDGEMTIIQQHFGQLQFNVSGGWYQTNQIQGTIIATML